ncbi:c-type cytochrome biogenesis protein CcmI [Biformimicrobium ophioploci]|uniref:C-type cytochrome biogenesis protein CcmI n=1 Tax=Biformimicrobium ophioploci TaxID=3036711 RepID=A0ABQ6LZY2_9GAMM|nr:c-type cytochrome biogenesis protein CcmI [Microbulbifer sp. NKW57]
MLGLLAAGFLLWPFFRKEHGSDEGVLQASDEAKRLYREYMRDLERDRDAGVLGEAEFAELEADAARKLMAEAGSEKSVSGTRILARWPIFAAAGLLVVVAVLLYRDLGAADGVALQKLFVESQSQPHSTVREQEITRRLHALVARNPEDTSSRYALAQRLMVSADISGAIAQYREILKIHPQESGVRAELAQALFFKHGKSITPEVKQLVDQVLTEDAVNTTALGLAGVAAFEEKRFADARDHWSRALTHMPAGSQGALALQAGVAQARLALGEVAEDQTGAVDADASVAQQPGDTAAQPTDKAASSIRIAVSLAGSASLDPATPVFVYARTADNPMPLAIRRLQVADLPTVVVLDESSAMMPGRSLASVNSVQLVARVAVGGSPSPQKGDWQGEIAALPRASWSESVEILINQQL